MYFVLPDEGVTPGDLLADRETLAEILAQDGDGGWGEVVLQVPKFQVSDSLDLRDTVAGLGAGIVFDEARADFSNLSEDALCLSSVKQEATLSIDEKGVTAAAFTQIDYAGAAPPDGPGRADFGPPLPVLCDGKKRAPVRGHGQSDINILLVFPRYLCYTV